MQSKEWQKENRGFGQKEGNQGRIPKYGREEGESFEEWKTRKNEEGRKGN